MTTVAVSEHPLSIRPDRRLRSIAWLVDCTLSRLMKHVRYDRLAVDSKPPLICVEVIDVTVDFNGRMIRSDLLSHEPS